MAADFRRVPGVTEVFTLDAVGDGDEPNRFRELVESADYSVVIAPESGDVLESRVEWAEELNAAVLGPSREATLLTADKLRLHDHWEEHRVPCPLAWWYLEWPGRVPAVLKPWDGAGSTLTYLVRSVEEAQAIWEAVRAEHPHVGLIAQDFVPGRAASVAFLVGPAQTVPLLPAFQFLSSDGRFRYQGGELPIPPDLAERAVALGRRVVGCVPGLLGYVGVDLVLGDATDGSADFAIEINPRLTTSYVGLRELANFNLAEALLRVVNGEPVEPRWNPGRVRFRPDGEVSADPTPVPPTG
jgi:predicted ATP-grasp superfamily ATP-dependent carboligase